MTAVADLRAATNVAEGALDQIRSALQALKGRRHLSAQAECVHPDTRCELADSQHHVGLRPGQLQLSAEQLDGVVQFDGVLLHRLGEDLCGGHDVLLRLRGCGEGTRPAAPGPPVASTGGAS